MRLSCSRVTISDGTFSEIQIGCKMTRKPEHSDLPKQPDKELHALFEKITGENPGSVDQAVQGARQALKIIERVRDQQHADTARTSNTANESQPQGNNDAFQWDVELPENIGRFKIKELIGQGGFGIVLRATDPNLDRDVALKIPRPDSFATPESLKRFAREGKAAAALAHPNIVPLFESGQFGQFFCLASEYVEGVTLDEWRKEKGVLPFKQMAEICRCIAEAVAHAHQRGIIHRDIKPANVLVSTNASAPLSDRIKITDFGLAKYCNEDSLQTRTGSLVGTPSFMSTEQAKQQSATEASDVYSIGAVLYWLLTGKPPFSRPSIIETLQSITNDTATEPRILANEVPADLNAICMKCLEKEPERRYAGAFELANDLDHWLRDEPVVARRPSWLERNWRWIKQNQLPAILLATLFFGIIGTSLGLIRAQSAETAARIAESNARDAEKQAMFQADSAEEVASFLVDIFKVAGTDNPNRKNNRTAKDITADELLIGGAKKVRTELKGQPLVQARMMETIGQVSSTLGMYDEAESLLRESLQIRRKLLSPDDLTMASTHKRLGTVLRQLDRNNEAIQEINNAIAIYELDIATNFNPLAKALNELGLLQIPNDATSAKASLQRARDLITTYKGAEDASLWQLDANIASLDYRAGNYEKARDSFERSLDGGKRILGENHPRLGAILGNLAHVYRKLGDNRRALDLQQQDVVLLRKNLGNEHPQLGIALMGLATSEKRIGRIDDALKHGLEAANITSTKLPNSHAYIFTAHNNYAETLSRNNDYEEARQQIELARKSLTNRSDANAQFNELSSLILLSRVERLDGNNELALSLIDDALVNEKIQENPSLLCDALFGRARVLAAMNSDEKDTAFAKAQSSVQQSSISPKSHAYQIARFNALSNDVEGAIAKLEEAYSLGFRDYVVLNDPDFHAINDDARFLDLKNRLKDASNQ